MSTQPLSFPEVLEEEYRYFFDEQPFGAITFDRRQVREIAGLAHFLDTLFQQGCASPTRWWLLAKRCFGPGGTSSRATSREDAVLDALNEMLSDPALLEHLGTDEHFRQAVVTDAALRQSLLRIPKARRLLLARPDLAAEMGADSLIDAFASRYAAIRLLSTGPFREAFRLYPALLSTIADNRRLARAVERDEKVRANLAVTFPVSRKERVVRWVAANIPRPAGMWLSRKFLKRPSDLLAMSADATKLQRLIDPNAPARPYTAAIPRRYLTRFNAILIETAYRHYVANGQTVRALYSAIHQKETAALCLSGGGIRSATFNLGVLQGLADHRMLNRFHYLSTVSGGGYIGSWLSSWTRRHREGAVGVAKDLARQAADPLLPEVQPIVHLREYSSYLAPRPSAFSLDSWTLVATYLRNLLLNWTMLLPFLVALLAIPRLLETYVRKSNLTAAHGLGQISILLIFFVAMAMGAMRPICTATHNVPRRSWSFWWWFVPLVASAVTFCICWASPSNRFFDWPYMLSGLFALAAFLSAVVHVGRRFWIDVMAETGSTRKPLLVKAFAFLLSARRFRPSMLWVAARQVVCTVAAGAIGGWLVHYVFVSVFSPRWLAAGMRTELYVVFGVPLFLLLFSAMTTLLVGFTTVFSEEYEREWWARSAAAVLVYGVMHVILAFAVLLLPAVIFEMPRLTAPVGGIAGVASYVISKQLKNIKSAEDKRSKWLLPALRVAAGVTMMFVIAGVSMLTSSLIGVIHDGPDGLRWLGTFFDFTPSRFPVPWLAFGDYPSDATVAHFAALRQAPLATLILLILVASSMAMAMSRLLNVNVYSMHGMYRNRLMRAYLGASRWIRRPDRFTGFDPQDNLKMWELRPEMLWPLCIIDFDAFARQLPAESFWKMVPTDTQNHVLAYLAADTPEQGRVHWETARTMIVDAINQLMLTLDLQRCIKVPPSLELLAANRAYLDSRFPKVIKEFVRDVDLPPFGHELTFDDDTPEAFKDIARKPVNGRPPLHIVNAALNLVSGENLAWQERKAASFTISPLHAGSRMLGYRDSFEYGNGVTLGTALAISGAAVSPNSGASSSPTFTFLMTLLNARLGWWLSNPARSRYRKNSPIGSIRALLCEALGRTNADHDFVFLSDGGHFENLGLYEMVLRRCKYIIVCDATADDGYAFGDLANAVRKIRIDLGIPIEPLLTKYIGPQADEKYGKYCALGEIRYANVDGGDSIGHLLYIKPAVYGDCPTDVRNYRNESKSFPHESTADQFFSESQFESYRALGRYIIGRIARDSPGNGGPNIAPNVAAFFASAYAYVNEKQPPVGDAPVGTMKDVVTWMATSLGEA